MPASVRDDRSASASKPETLMWRVWLLLGLVGLALAGCGGGGGASSSDQLQVSTRQISVTAQTTDPAPTALIQASVQTNSAAGTQTSFYITGNETHNGIDTVTAAGSGGVDNITVTFKAPATLGPGTYSDTMTIEGCYDQGCSRQIGDSPQTVSLTYTVTSPTPQIYSITPSSVIAGVPAFTLTVSGSNFVTQSVVLWNGSPRTTTYVSASQLSAQITAADVGAAGSYSVTVSNASAGGPVSSATAFTVTSLGPLALNSISPSQVAAGGSAFMLTAIGTGFASTSSIAWNGTSLPTTYVSSTMIRAQVTAAQIANTGTVAITVVGAGSQASSSPVNLTIVPPTVDAVSYQMNPAHTGAVTFKTIALPSGSAWSVDVGGSPSYALVVGGQVFVTVALNGNSQLLALNGTTGARVWGPIAFSGYVNAAYDG
jgi:hypothetical protein